VARTLARRPDTSWVRLASGGTEVHCLFQPADPKNATLSCLTLFVFDPWRSAVLLMAVDKSGRWKQWYQAAIPQAEQLFEDYLAEREKEMGL
jgi:hypothetical protein